MFLPRQETDKPFRLSGGKLVAKWHVAIAQTQKNILVYLYSLGVLKVAAVTPAESLVAVSFGHYMAERTARAEEILALKELPLNDTEAVVGTYPLGENSRTAAAISGYLAVNNLLDHGADTDRIVNNVYQHGLRLHAVITALGKVGIFAGMQDISGAYHTFSLHSRFEDLPERRVVGDSILGSLLDIAQSNLDEAELSENALAELLGNEFHGEAVRTRLIGMHAIHVAELEHWEALSGHEGMDLLNLGAQLYCMLAHLQQNGAQHIHLKDADRFAVQFPDDLNGLALGDNHHWLEACGPAVKLT